MAQNPTTDRRKPLNLSAGSLAFLLASLWAGLPIAVKAGLEDSPPLRLGFMRFVLGMIVVIIWAIIARQSFRVERSELWPLFILGILFSVQTAFMNLGQYFTTAGHTGVLITTFPLWAGVFAHFLVPNDKLSKRRVIGAMIAYLGAAAIFVRSVFGGTDAIEAINPWLGDLLIMCSAVLLGLRQVYLSQLGSEGQPCEDAYGAGNLRLRNILDRVVHLRNRSIQHDRGASNFPLLPRRYHRRIRIPRPNMAL